MTHDAAERAAMAQHYAEPPAPQPYTRDTPDPLRDGLLKAWQEQRERKP